MSISKFHKFLSKSKLCLNVSIKLRNQINCIIQHHVSNGCDMKYNGELFLLKHLVKHCKTFIDVGANSGEWSREVINFKDDIESLYLFEPQRDLYTELKTNFISPDYHIHNTALSDCSKTVPFHYDGRSSRIAENKNLKEDFITTKRLDTIITTNSDFIKIDRQGHDYKVILGSENIISNDLNKFIQFEYNDFWVENSSTLKSCLDFFNSYEYKLFRIDKNSLINFDYAFLGDYFRYSNFIAIKNKYLYSVNSIIC